MRVGVDRAGRVVIPKHFRVALGIGPDSEVELIPDGAGLRMDPIPADDRAVTDEDGLPLLGLIPGLAVTDEDVRALRDEMQR